MSTMILQTKLYIPPPARDYISRPRLLEQLDAGVHSGHRLLLVAAPAGFGKTTVVSDWLRQRDLPAAWLSLDRDENDPLRFLAYFIAALQQVDRTLGEDALSMLQSPQPPELETSLTALLNQLTGRNQRLVIVLDDFQQIVSRSIHQALIFFIENLPPQVHLALVSRADPPLPLARLRARGQMTELRAADLRFTLDEVVPFFKEAMGLVLSEEQVRSLETRTEGWVTGLQMAALSIRGKSNVDEFITAFSGSHRFVLDYLTEEVLQGQSPALQDFILQTAVLNRLSGPLCEAVTGQPGGQETLEALEEANLFLVPLDDDRLWYRYHHLFADVMANRLQRVYPDRVAELHRRAARWFLAQESDSEAIEHAVAGEDIAFAVELVEARAHALLQSGQISILFGWISKLPPEAADEHPLLNVIYAWVYLLVGSQEPVESYLVAAEAHLEKARNPEELRGEIAAIRAYAFSRLGQFEQAAHLAQTALALLPEEAGPVRAVVNFILGGLRFMAQDLPQALTYMETTARLGEQSGNIHVAVQALNAISSLLRMQGDLDAAEKATRQALRLGTSRSGQLLPIAGGVYVGLAEISIARRELDAAREHIRIAQDLGARWVNAECLVSSYLALVQVEALEENPRAAQAALEQAKQIAAAHQITPDLEAQLAAFEVGLAAGELQIVNQGALPEPLTERELEVLGLLAAGLSNRAIADTLVIALGTVKTHISRVMGKLSAENRTQAVNRARELGLIP